jgi:hypothetical protein
MNKVKIWLLNNKNNIIVSVTSFLVFFVLISSLWTAKSAFDRYENNKLKNACNEAYKIMCVQVHMCTTSPVRDCDAIVEREELCSKVELLPSVEIMLACKEDLRHIECKEAMPGTCQTFME